METKTQSNAITREMAEAEVNGWLDHKKVSAKKRDDQKDSVKALVDAIEEGHLIMNPETKVITHKLKFPLTSGDRPIESLDYKPRLDIKTVHKAMEGVKASDADGRILAYVAALSSKPKAVIEKFDSEDYSICQSVAIFFL